MKRFLSLIIIVAILGFSLFANLSPLDVCALSDESFEVLNPTADAKVEFGISNCGLQPEMDPWNHTSYASYSDRGFIYMAFDIEEVLRDKAIEKAKLKIYIRNNVRSPNLTLDFLNVYDKWEEKSIVWTNQPVKISGKEQTAAESYYPEAKADLSVKIGAVSTTEYVPLEIDITALINKYAESESTNDFSFMIVPKGEYHYGRTYIPSKEYGDASLHPFIELTTSNVRLPIVSLSKIKSETQKVIQNGHPRIFANKKNFEQIKKYAFGRDKILTNQYKNIKRNADSAINQIPIEVTVDTNKNSYIGTAVSYWKNAMALAMVYNVEGIEKYAEAAWKQAEYIIGMDNWGTYQMIDNVQTAFSLAIVYDWLYDWLSESQKKQIKDALLTKHLDTMSDLYNNPDKPKYQETFYLHVFGSHNHPILDNSLTFMCSMAIAEENIDFHSDIMSHALKNLNKPWKQWYPDSGWPEGVGYWNYAGVYTAQLLICMKQSFGHCFGYEDVDWLMNVGDFPIYAESSNGAFMWGDIDQGTSSRSSVLFNIGALSNNKSLMTWALDDKNTGISKGSDVLFVIMYNPEEKYDSSIDLKLDKLFRNTDLVTMRNTFEGNQELFCAMAVQSAAANVGHLAGGTIGIDALGERWISNHGKEIYYNDYTGNLDSRWTYYRARTEAQSCVVINPSEDGGQNAFSEDSISVYETGADGSYAIIDLTETYEGQVKNYRRGMQLTNNRKTVVVQDELVMTKKSEIYSFFNIYKGEIQICDDGKSAIVKKGNKKMLVTVEADREFEMSIMDSVPLPTSPVPANPNSANTDYKKIALHFIDIDSANVRVCFTPFLSDVETQNIFAKNFVPMSEWKVSNDPLIEPIADDIMIDGLTIGKFNSHNRYYEIQADSLPLNVSVSFDKSKFDTQILSKNGGSLTEIIVSDKSNPSNINTYLIFAQSDRRRSYPQTTYSTTEFEGAMMPQEYHRMQNSESVFAPLYIKDSAPAGFARAILTMYAYISGNGISTSLNGYALGSDTVLENITGSNALIKTETLRTKLIIEQSGLYKKSGGLVKLEYDITDFVSKDGGDFVLALIPAYRAEEYLEIVSYRNNNNSYRPIIKYYTN